MTNALYKERPAAEFYQKDRFGMFGWNYADTENLVLKGLDRTLPTKRKTVIDWPWKKSSQVLDWAEKHHLLPRFRKIREYGDTDINIMMRDINPYVFGQNGELYKYLKELASEENAHIRIASENDHDRTLVNVNGGIEVIVGKCVEEAFANHGLRLDACEVIISKGEKIFVAVYNRREDKTICLLENFPQTYEKYKLRFENAWGSLTQ